MSIRIERVNSEIQKALSLIISRMEDPRISSMLSVTNVETSPDMKNARVYVSVFGDTEKTDSTYEALQASRSFIKKELCRALKSMHTVPAITFLKDGSIEYADKINRILKGLNGNSEPSDKE